MSENEPSVDPTLPRPLPVPSLADRVRDVWAGAPVVTKVLGGAFVVVVVLGAALWLARSSPPPVEDSLPMASSTAMAAPSSTGVVDVVAHAAGAVVTPGVYRLPTGSRVTDLVAAAGGLAADAEPDRINLAAVLVDGQRVYVPRVGEAVAEPADPVTSGAVATEPVDLNTASIAELDALPGIGPATAQAIVDYREAHGPFRSVDELLDVRGIGDAKLVQLRPLVRV